MATSTIACGVSSASLCDRVCECMGCSESERTSCVDQLDDTAKAADERGCSDSYDAWLECVDDEPSCVADRVEADGCEAEARALAACDAGGFAGLGDPCTMLCEAVDACDGGDSSCGSTQCTQAQQACAQCYLDNVADVCTPTTDELSNCTDACSG